MIKTKTPRHWGGGIRQVSPPMLTSRLSNKRGGRTNGWKDYSRSSNFKKQFENCVARNNHFKSNVDIRYHAIVNDSNIISQHFSSRIYLHFRRLGAYVFYLYNKRQFISPFSCVHSRFYFKQNYIQLRKYNSNQCNVSRLTLKGVA